MSKEMDQQQVRTWYVDSRHCEEKKDRSLQLDLHGSVELSAGHACYIDDLGVSGTLPNVATNSSLYLYEWTPTEWAFLGQTVTSF